MSLIQLTRGQEETLCRIVTALEKIAEHTEQPKASAIADKSKLYIVVRVDRERKFSDIDAVATDIDSANNLVKTEASKSYGDKYEWTIVEYECSDIIK